MEKILKHINYFIGLQIIQIAITIIWMLSTPSESGVGKIHLSLSRLIIVGFLFSLFIFLVFILIKKIRSPHFLYNSVKILKNKLFEDGYLISIIFILFSLALFFSLWSRFVFSTPLTYTAYENIAPNTFPTIYVITQRMLPVILFTIAFCLELIIFLFITYKQYILDVSFWSQKAKFWPIFVSFLMLVSVTHWLILIFQIRIFVNLPAWYWVITDKPISNNGIIYFFPITSLLILSYWMIMKKKKIWYSIISFILLSFWSLFGLNLLDQNINQSQGDRYFSTYHSNYLFLASINNDSILNNIVNYEENFSKSLFTSTKPPGLMTVYLIIERIINGNPNDYLTDEIRLERLRSTIVYFFPIISSLMVILLLLFLKKILQFSDFTTIMVIGVYILSPNVISFSLFADQVFYPILFLIGIMIINFTIKRQSLLFLFFSGFIFYIFSFIAFSLLSLFLLAVIHLLLYWLANSNKLKFINQFKLGISFLLGLLSSYWIFRWIFNYDFFTRFEKTMEINYQFDFYTRVGKTISQNPEPLYIRLKQILDATVTNNLEFASTVGFFIYILFIVYGIRIIVKFLKKDFIEHETILLSLFLTFVGMNLFGSAQGEVGRLWLFWVPIFSIFAVREIRFSGLNLLYQVLFIHSIQLVNFFLLFHYQDLIM